MSVLERWLYWRDGCIREMAVLERDVCIIEGDFVLKRDVCIRKVSASKRFVCIIKRCMYYRKKHLY